jgi:hypothetical protein
MAVRDRDIVAGEREDLGDAVAHQSGSNYGNTRFGHRDGAAHAVASYLTKEPAKPPLDRIQRSLRGRLEGGPSARPSKPPRLKAAAPRKRPLPIFRGGLLKDDGSISSHARKQGIARPLAFA